MRKISFNLSLINLVAAAVISIALGSNIVHATCLYEDFNGWKDCFIKEKLSTNLNSYDLDTFQSAQFLPKVVELDRNQPEKKLTFQQYAENIGIEKFRHKIIKGKEFYFEHKSTLDHIGESYGVEPAILVALLGMESNYGTNMGSFNVIDSLASLSFEGRRKEFFEKELLNALQISKNERLPYDRFRGSWAGAMGQVQFMPSSYLNFAVDYDQDGVADIWNSTEDVFASAANYLKSNGWQYGHSSVNEAKGGLECKDNTSICDIGNDMKLVRLQSEDQAPSFEVGKNFQVLMKWNRSVYFGLSVLIIAREISL